MRRLFRSNALVTGLCALAIAALMAAGVASASPVALQTPAGLAPGDHFRFLYITSATIQATSTDISTYDALVTLDAGGATYGGSVVNWKVLGSTASVSARDHVGGFGSNVAVYNTLGQLLAPNLTTSNGGLWADIQLPYAILMMNGTQSAASTAWTGSNSSGTANAFGHALGDVPTFQGIKSGYAVNGGYQWISGPINNSPTDSKPLYAMSEELTVAAVPEIDPAGASSILALVGGAIGLAERRKGARRRER